MSRSPSRPSEPPSPHAIRFFEQIADFARSPKVDNLSAVSAAVMLIHRDRQRLDEMVDVRLFAMALPADFAEIYETAARAAFGSDGRFDGARLLRSLERLASPLQAAAFIALFLHDIKPEHRHEIIDTLARTVAARIAERKTH